MLCLSSTKSLVSVIWCCMYSWAASQATHESLAVLLVQETCGCKLGLFLAWPSTWGPVGLKPGWWLVVCKELKLVALEIQAAEDRVYVCIWTIMHGNAHCLFAVCAGTSVLQLSGCWRLWWVCLIGSFFLQNTMSRCSRRFALQLRLSSAVFAPSNLSSSENLGHARRVHRT